MNKEEFALIMLKVAIGSIFSDGEVADEEINSLRRFEKTDFYLKEYDLEEQIEYYQTKFNARGYLMIRNILNEVATAELDETQKLILIDLAIQIIRADKLITKDEVDYVKQLISNLMVPNFIVDASHSNWWLMEKNDLDDTIEKEGDV